VRQGVRSQRTDDRAQTTLWTIPARDDAGHGHGTQKPVACMRRPMENHDASIIYDPFLGSGTSMVAAEQLGKTCVGLEIEPRYCQVILDRVEAFTGKPALKVGEAVRV
jgi:DNA modification methylase